MSVRIYFCGEAVTDLLEQNEGSGDFKLFFGGSAFHGARGAKLAVERAKLAVEVGFVGPLSRDMLGDRFFKILTDMKIDTTGIARVDRPTTLALIAIHPGQESGYVFYGRDSANQMTRAEDLPRILGDKDDRKIFCFGSISTFMEPARYTWLEFARHQSEESLVFYDLNTRPSIARNPAAYREVVLEWARLAHIMKASDTDIGWTYPGKSPKEVADIWFDAGAQMAVFTKGAHGSEAYTRAASATAPSVDLVSAVNTVGAGNNFSAGFAVNLARNGHMTPEALAKMSFADLGAALEEANATAAFHLISLGAQQR